MRHFLQSILLLTFLTTCSTTTTSESPPNGNPTNPDLILATTTSTQDSGLLDILLPHFQQQTGYQVKTVAVGTGAALKMAQEGNTDVLLVHAPRSRTSPNGSRVWQRPLAHHAQRLCHRWSNRRSSHHTRPKYRCHRIQPYRPNRSPLPLTWRRLRHQQKRIKHLEPNLLHPSHRQAHLVH